MMSPLLRVALQLCPSEFRREHSAEITADFEQSGKFAGLADIVWAGLVLRVENLARDLSFAIRSLQKSRTFLVVTVLTIAVAIAANVAVAAMIDGMLLKPLPFAHSDKLVEVFSIYRGGNDGSLSYPNAHDLFKQSRSFSAFSVQGEQNATLTGVGQPLNLNGLDVEAGYFEMLGARPEIGRFFKTWDEGQRRVVISDKLWRERFHADSSVIGKSVQLSDHAYTVVAVAPPKFVNPGRQFLSVTDYWVPIDIYARNTTMWRGHYRFLGIARLAPGVSLQSARADATRVAQLLAAQYPSVDKGWGFYVVPLQKQIVGPISQTLEILYAGVVLVLLIAGANVANLLFVRLTSREYEFDVRAALGASRQRLAAQLACEMFLLASVGGMLGLGLGALALRAFKSFAQSLLPPWMNVAIPGWDRLAVNGPVIAYAVAIVLGFTVFVGLLPALLRHRSLARAINATARQMEPPTRGRLRNALVIAEVVMAFALLVSTGLLLRSFAALSAQSAGFDPHNLYYTEVDSLSAKRYPSFEAQLAFATRVAQRLQAIPGVTAVGEGMDAPFDGSSSTNYWIPGRPKSATPSFLNYGAVMPGYFHALGIRVLRGRDFTNGDTRRSQPVAIVNAAFARKNFGTLNVLGRSFGIGTSVTSTFPVLRIVGVVSDTRSDMLAGVEPKIFEPAAQLPFVGFFIIRTAGPQAQLANEVYRSVSAIDPLLAPPQIIPAQMLIDMNESLTRVSATLLLIVSCVALLLALSGVYGLVAFSMERRIREFGIRQALGAQERTLLAGVLKETLRTTCIGVALGIGLAAVFALALRGLLFQIGAFDPPTYAGVALFLALCSCAAALIPAMRATRVNPVSALRYE